MSWNRLMWTMDRLGLAPLQWLILLVFSGGLIWLVARLRDRLRESNDGSAFRDEFLQQAQELHSDGQLSAEEFRLIKSRLMRESARRELGDRFIAATVSSPKNQSAASEPSANTEESGSSSAVEGKHKQQDEPSADLDGEGDSGQNHPPQGS